MDPERFARQTFFMEPSLERLQYRWTQFCEIVLTREDAAAESELAEYLLSRKEPAFYFSEDEAEGIVRAYRQSFPHRIPEIVEEAERLCAHRMTIFGYPEVSCGVLIPWRTDLIHGIESGLEHWSQYPYLDFSKGG